MQRLLIAAILILHQLTGGTVAAASIEQMAGQMIIVGFKGQRPEEPTVRRIASDVRQGRIGGVILFGRNIRDPGQLKQLTGHLRKAASSQPPIIAVDQEGGRIQRLTSAKGFTAQPSADFVGRTKSVKEAYDLYHLMAAQLKFHGINMNLAPVVDLNINPHNPIIGKLHRSFGDDEKLVFKFAEAFVSAHRSAGVLTCLKHWPGHGSASSDSHIDKTTVADLNRVREQQVYVDFVEHRLADAIMASHVVPYDEESGVPATLSDRSIGYLRVSVGFQGVVISDDMQMGAIAKRYEFEDSVVKAVSAGVDMLIFGNMLSYDPDVADKARLAIVEAVGDGRLDRARLVASFERISALKAQLQR